MNTTVLPFTFTHYEFDLTNHAIKYYNVVFTKNFSTVKRGDKFSQVNVNFTKGTFTMFETTKAKAVAFKLSDV